MAAAALLVSTVAGAIPYDFRFTSYADPLVYDGVGSFTTGAESTADAGYYLLTSLRFTQLRDGDGTVFDGLVSTTTFLAGAAFNPTTRAFVNHFGGDTYDDFGGAQLRGAMGANTGFDVYGDSFQIPRHAFLFGAFRGPSPAPSSSNFLSISPAAVPEPETMVLLLPGVAAYGLLRVRQRRKHAATRAAWSDSPAFL